jgi:hypothetical protein
VNRHRSTFVLFVLLSLASAGCALVPWWKPARPASAPPPASPAAPAPRAAVPDTTPYRLAPPAPRAPSTWRRTVADTLAARRALRRCEGKKLLPEQESTYEATALLLLQAREALQRKDAAEARSLARRARLLSSSLTCY